MSFIKSFIIISFVLLATSFASAKIRIGATLLEKSATPTKEERGAYLEGLVNYLYQVDEVTRGELEEERILVSHYAVFDDREQEVVKWKQGDQVELTVRPFEAVPDVQEVYLSDEWELDFELRRFHQVDQTLERQKPSEQRFDYGDSARQKALAPLVGLRNQLRAVATGDSQTENGINPAALFPLESPFVTVAHNAANPASRLPWSRLVVEDYLVNMPDLELVLLGINPRMFSESRGETGPHPVEESPGYRADMELAGNGWRLPWELVREDPRDRLLPNGYERSLQRLGSLEQPGKREREETKRRVERRLDRRYDGGDETPETYRIDPSIQKAFERMLEETADRGFDIIGFKPPISPVVLDYPGIIDEDSTPPEGYDRLVAYLEGLDARFPHFHFVDIDRKARHFLEIEHFRDTDHATDLGSAMLTAHIEALRPKGAAPRIDARVEGRTLSLRSNTEDVRWYLSDKTVLRGQEATHVFEDPGTYWVGAAGTVGEGRVGSAWTEVEIPERAFDNPSGSNLDVPEPIIEVHRGRNVPGMLFFNATRSDDAVMAVWDFGDGSRASGFFLQHEYDRPGDYEVTLSAYSDDGLKKSVTKTINVPKK